MDFDFEAYGPTSRKEPCMDPTCPRNREEHPAGARGCRSKQPEVEAVEQMSDPERYAELRKTTERHPCPVKDCRLSAEEHHRLAYGMIAENHELRRRLKEAGL